jgi:outer membrane protein assembly factor BamA
MVVKRRDRRAGRLFTPLVALLLFLAAPSFARAQAPSCRPGDAEVRSLHFNGNKAFPDGELSQIVATTTSSFWRRTFRIIGRKTCLDRDELARDVVRLKLYYRKRGYRHAKVDSIVTPHGKDGVDVAFDIVENQPIALTALRITGLDSVLDRRAILRGLDTSSGGAFDEFRLSALSDSIANRLLDNGYPSARLLQGFDVDTVAWTATYDITVDPGKLARIGEVRVVVDTSRGEKQKIRSRTVKKILGLRPGQIYRRRDVVAAQRNLYATDAYRHVELGLAPDQTAEDSLVVVQASLIEGDMRNVQAGVGWANLDCFRTQGTYTDRNFLRGARRLDFTSRLSKLGVDVCEKAKKDTLTKQLNYYAGATYRQPTFLGLRARNVPTFTLYSERRSEYKQYVRETPIGLLASVTRELKPRMPLTFGYQIELGRTRAQDAFFCALFKVCDRTNIDALSKNNQRLAVASVSLTSDHTDFPVSPTHGGIVRLELRHASRYIGSAPTVHLDRGVADASFNKAVGDASWYMPLGNRTVFATRLRVGGVVGGKISTRGFDLQGKYLPPQERLYAGGPNTVRGFQQNELGPVVYVAKQAYVVVTQPDVDTRTFSVRRDSTGPLIERKGYDFVPTGGNTLVVANAEVRLRDPFFPNLLQYTLFVDAGKVWERGGGALFFDDKNKIKWTPGIGVSVLTFLGPIGVTAGYNNYPRQPGVLYYNDQFIKRDDSSAEIGTVTNGTYCLDPSGVPTVARRINGVWVQDGNGSCPTGFSPVKSNFRDRITLQFSIGQAF